MVFVVDDDPSVLDSISCLLASQGLSTECFISAEAFRSQVDETRHGCLVVDLRMPGMSGIQLLEQLANDGRSRPAIVITGNAEIESVVRSMRLGAIDFLQKPFPPSKLLDSVRKALEIDQTQRAHRNSRNDVLRKIDALSEDQKTVLWGIVRGLTNQEIADEMQLSLRTVLLRKSSLLDSLALHSKSELIALVQSVGWSPNSPS